MDIFLMLCLFFSTINNAGLDIGEEVWTYEGQKCNIEGSGDRIWLSELVEKGVEKSNEEGGVKEAEGEKREGKINTCELLAGLSGVRVTVEKEEGVEYPFIKMDGIVEGKGVASVIEGYDMEQLKSALLGLMNRDDPEGKRCLLIYSPSENTLSFISANMKEEVSNLNFKLYGNLEVSGVSRMKSVESKGDIQGEQLNVSKSVYAGDTVYGRVIRGEQIEALGTIQGEQLNVSKSVYAGDTVYGEVIRGEQIEARGTIQGEQLNVSKSVYAGDTVYGGVIRGEQIEARGAIQGEKININEFNLFLGSEFIDLTDADACAYKACDYDGRYLYIGMYKENDKSTLRIYDCKEPEQPVLISPEQIDGFPEGNIRGLKSMGDMLYIVCSRSKELPFNASDIFRIVDIKNRKQPIVRGGKEVAFKEEPSGGNFLDIDKKNNLVYLCTTQRVYSIDVSNPDSPRIIGDITLGSNLLNLWAIKYQSGYIYCAGRGEEKNTLYILDVTDPSNMKEIKAEQPVDLKEGTWSLDVDGDYVYIASGGNFTYTDDPKFYIINVSEKNQPKIEASLFIGKSVCSYVKKVGDYVYLSTFHYKEDNLFVVDVSNPKNPRIVGSGRYGNMMVALCPILQGRYIYTLFNLIDRQPPYFGVVKRGSIRTGGIEANDIQITEGGVLKIGKTEISEEQLQALLKIIDRKKR
ncbi:MAG: hypothetical protein LDL53_07420 [Candidatus Hydrogenedens sp.]|nr:hypothetical protein [Candidatus Hydrogenedens sp.]